MLNAEKYRDEIFKRAENINERNMPISCYKLSHAIDLICGETLGFEETVEWLLSEYEPPLLDNGDNLKVGDWIMVSNHKESWKNRQFLYFWQGCFYAANLSTSPEQGEAVKWNYARLPEEGE